MSGKRILVVDDDEGVLNVIREALETVGCQVHTASDAASAVELIHDVICDAALVDFELPDMNGILLHRKLRKIDPELARRTIFMSGLVEAQSHGSYFDSESAGFLPKPFDTWALVGAICMLTGAVPAHENLTSRHRCGA
jgi:chemosensory pili system protein ChpA (sensor histidine kinase/response regulator)